MTAKLNTSIPPPPHPQPEPPLFRQCPYEGCFYRIKASLRGWHNAMTTIFILAKAGDRDIALTKPKMVPQKLTEKGNIPKGNKFKYVTFLTVTALLGYDRGLPIDNSHGKKKD